MKSPGTFAFLLRWQFAPFVGGLCLALFSAYQLIAYVEPAPSPLSAVVSSPVRDNFVPIMWIFFIVGSLVAMRAFLRARSMAGK